MIAGRSQPILFSLSPVFLLVRATLHDLWNLPIIHETIELCHFVII